jgi:hypothetical protein
MAKVYALDQNYFRSDELKQVIADDPTAKFVILDIAFLEMTKGEEWRKIMQRSLATLARKPGRVLGAISVAEAMRHESEKLEHATLNMVCKEHTRFFRALVTELAANDLDGPTVTQIAARISTVKDDLSRDELHHEKNLNRLQETTLAVKRLLSPEGLKLLKSPACTDVERLSVVYFVASVIAQEHLVKEGYSTSRIKKFLKGNPLFFRYHLALVRHSMEWAIKGGIENLTPEKATNDVIDQEYVVAGSFFDGLLSHEHRVAKADKELRFMLSIKSPVASAL